MSDKKTNISITASGKTAEMCIKGVIFETDGDWIEYLLKQMIADGVTDCHIDMNGIGGNVFAAAQIANQIRKFPGKVTGHIGAICASALTYIACACSHVTMARNGQYMFHKPKRLVEGNEDEISSQVKPLANITKDYKRVYAKQTGLTPEEIEAMWKQDYWMDADEALEKGFIHEIVEEDAEFSNDIFAQLEEAHHPKLLAIKAQINTNQISKNMSNKLPLITAAAGLPEDSSESQIALEISKINAKASKADAFETENKELKAQLKTAQDSLLAEQETKITALVDGVIAANKIPATEKDRYITLAKGNFTVTSEILAAMKPYKAITATLETGKTEGTAINSKYADWDFEKFQKEAPKVLAEMKANEPARFNELLEDFKKRQK